MEYCHLTPDTLKAHIYIYIYIYIFLMSLYIHVNYYASLFGLACAIYMRLMGEVGQQSQCEELMRVVYERELEQDSIDLSAMCVSKWEWRIFAIFAL